MKILLLIFWVFMAQGFALNTYSVEEIRADFKAGKSDKYRYDNLQLLDSKNLIEKGMFSSKEVLKPIGMDKETCSDKLDHNPLEVFDCKANILNNKFTSSLYDINLKSGTYMCAVAESKYRPFGYFILSVPDGCKKFLKKDKIKAKEVNKEIIKDSESLYDDLYKQKQTIKDSVSSYDGEHYLNISDVLLSTVLTDTDIIDVQASKSTNRVQLKDGFNSQITDHDSEDVSSNTDFISTTASVISDIYARLSSLSMTYLFLLVILFGIYGVSRALLVPVFSKIEKKEDHDKKLPFISTAIAGMLLFFPVSREDIQINSNNSDIEEYSVMQSNYMKWEKSGYYLFQNWSMDITKAVTDGEMDKLISSAGLNNSSDIIFNYASKEQTAKFFNINRRITQLCTDIYSKPLIQQLRSDKTNIFPTSELSFYAENIISGNGAKYYSPILEGGVVKKYSHSENQGKYYPDILLSACGKSNSKLTILEKKYNDYDTALEKATTELNNPNNGKIEIVKNLISFQYKLQEKFGVLSILGLPVTVMQTKNIGVLSNVDTDIKEMMLANTTIDSATHSFLSSLPFLLVPGASTVYETAKDNSLLLGTVTAAAAGSTLDESSALSRISGAILGGITGAIQGQFLSGSVGVIWGYQAAITLLSMSPIIVIFLVGLGRFTVIISRIFVFHFASIFLMPMLFLKKNTQAVTKFSSKILGTMLELPLYPLSIWLAITIHTLIDKIGKEIGKEITVGMVDNLVVSSQSKFSVMKIYFFDGLIQVGISLISIVIAWKIIVTMHSSVLELFEVNTSSALDSALDSMAGEHNKIKI